MQNPKRKYVNPTFKGGHAYRWGYIKRLSAYKAPTMALDHHGNSYVADPSGGPWMWDLQCECGHQWTILETDFPGKTKLRSCGRPECPHSQPPVRKRKEPKSICTLSLDLSLLEYAHQYAAEHNLSLSAAFNAIVWAGVKTLTNATGDKQNCEGKFPS